MKNYLFALLLILSITGCKKDGAGADDGNSPFDTFKQQFIDGLWKQNPDWASSVGYHKYDSVLVVPTDGSRAAQKAFYQSMQAQLASFDLSKLPPLNQIDYRLIQNQLQSSIWQIDTLKQYQWDPSSYNVIGSFAFILNEQYAPLTTRLKSFYQKMENIPTYYEEAKKQIKNPVPELTSLAAEQHLGGVSVIEKDFGDSLKKTKIPLAEQKLMLARVKTSVAAINSFAQWLKDFKNPTPRSFRLGKDFYAQKFKYDVQSAYSAKQIYDSAVVRKRYLHGQMYKISKQLWPQYFGKKAMPADTLLLIGKIIDTLSVKHVKPEDFQSAIEKTLPQLVDFVKQKNLLYIDPSKPLIVRKEPGYMAGVAGASCSSPGPYDKGGNTYFNVGSLAGWPKEKAESYLREYNQYMLQILCIHEAIPGHYTQLVYANQSPSLIKSILGNGAMIEGWAVYTEQMMLDNGFGNNDPGMWMMWYKWNLRSVCNTIVDYGVHTGTLTRDDVIKMLTKQAFQQQAEAEGKWKRVSVSSVQLTSYYTGYKEITDLRDAYKKKMGTTYKLKEFNEKFLSYGSAPVKYIRELMLAK
ncbi:uncharacterized protein (DUF885 family) [Mucilaginibacter gracilis]|uniref:Uncharacterized protein (DUF885 family) n=1 Tax=Mucilaginibacter gracilis TaxID=423350 RepID=A0A495J148_9SPHI|nr:DUF885 domain-containing protein [Mucilaginibacter gracilis]RKR82483.1 uncharacterized protein (DUF885 family) [Mucilaginibacter gracilis]